MWKRKMAPENNSIFEIEIDTKSILLLYCILSVRLHVHISITLQKITFVLKGLDSYSLRAGP